MEESQEILLNSVANSGVEIPTGVSSIEDLTPATLFSICAQSLNLIDDHSSFPTSLPESMADRFKICTEIASAVENLGFIGDMSFHKFLYPSEDDLYKLVRFLVERLSELLEVGKSADRGDINASGKTNDDFKGTLKDRTENDRQGVNWNDEEVRTRLKDLKLKTEVSESRMHDSSGLEVKRVESRKNAEESAEVESADQRDEKDVSKHEQKLLSTRGQSSKIGYALENLRSQEKKITDEKTTKSLESQNPEHEYELSKAATEMAFDGHHPSDFYVGQLNEQIDARRRNLVELESQWETLRKPLEEKKRSLEEVLATKPEGQKPEQTELEIEAVLSEMKTREEEIAKLSAILEKQPKVPTRRSYIQRITEITKNSRKQDADIEKILKETRDLQLESNSIQERLHRTYAVVDEIVFREAKKDPVARQAYRLLTSIHEGFEQISEKILATDRTRREVAEHEAKLAALASQSLDIDKLQADLDAIRMENEFLEGRLHDT